jgi:deoxyribonucleoside regulator
MTKKVLGRDEEIKLMVRCAELYYLDSPDGNNQGKIAKALGITPTRVSRLLKQAQQEGIINIEITPPRLQSLELKLMDKYGLKDALVIPSGENQSRGHIGKVAAEYFTRIAKNDLKVSLGSGTTILKMVESLEPLEFIGHSIYPISSESTLIQKDYFPSQITSLMRNKYRYPAKTTAYSFRIPALSEEDLNNKAYEEAFQLILESKTIQTLLNEARNSDIFILGVGSLNGNSPGFDALVRAHGLHIDELHRFGIVGVINHQFYNARGEIVEATQYPKLKRLMATQVMVNLEDLRRAASSFGKYVIALAGGADKIGAIKGALQGRFFNVLITDAEDAEALLN